MRTLIEGQNIPLTQENPDLKQLAISFQHKSPDKETQDEMIFAAILCDKNGKGISPNDLIYFNQMEDDSESVAIEDNEQIITIKLDKVPKEVETIDFVNWINNGKRNLSQLNELKFKVINRESNQQLTSCEINPKTLDNLKVIITLQLYRYKGEWKIKFINQGWSGGVQEMLKQYGLNHQDGQ